MSGMFSPKQSPFAADTPMRNPVYEPGPLLIATALSSCNFLSHLAKISSIKTCSFSE